MEKMVIDVCCGPKGMWFNKNDERALFLDKRCETHKNDYPSGYKEMSISPDVIGDFTQVFPRPKSEVRRRINQAIASAVEARESKLSESVEKMKKARPTGAECVNHPESAAWDEVCVIHNNALDQVLSIINPSNE